MEIDRMLLTISVFKKLIFFWELKKQNFLHLQFARLAANCEGEARKADSIFLRNVTADFHCSTARSDSPRARREAFPFDSTVCFGWHSMLVLA